MSKLVKHSFLEKTINISFPDVWKVEQKDYNMAEVKFPFGPYPVLGCYFKCFDGPKINSEEKIKSYLLEGVENNVPIEKSNNLLFFFFFFFLSSQSSSGGECVFFFFSFLFSHHSIMEKIRCWVSFFVYSHTKKC